MNTAQFGGLEEEALKQQKELQEFYATYDVWTGVRTAITLALFFLFTVSIIVYKSRGKKTPDTFDIYPVLEDMQDRPLDYCDYWCTETARNEIGLNRGVMGRCYDKDVRMGSAPLPRQESVGSYSSLATSFRVKSLPGSVMAMNWSRMSSYDMEEGTSSQSRSEFLRVPGIHQQIPSTSVEFNSVVLSSAADPRTGASTAKSRPILQLGGMDWNSNHATAEWLQTIDINVIQPTPNISPCSSMRSVSDHTSSFDRGTVPSMLSLSRQSFGSESLASEIISNSHEKSDAHKVVSNQSAPHATLSVRPKNSSFNPNLLNLSVTPDLSGSCEKLSMNASLKEQGSKSSLKAVNSIEEDPHMVSFTVPNLRRTLSASTNGGSRNNSLKVKVRSSPMKRADSASNAMKRCDSETRARKNSSGSTSSTDEASESVSFHLMVPQLSMDCPSQDVSRASTPSSSPTPPPSPKPKRPLERTSASGNGKNGRGVLRRQFARDYTQPCMMLPTYLEEEETNANLSIIDETIKPPPGYRDSSPLSSTSSTPLEPSSPLTVPPSPASLTAFPYPMSPSPNSMMYLPSSPIPPPPSPLYSSVRSYIPPVMKSPSPSRITLSDVRRGRRQKEEELENGNDDRKVGRQRSYSLMTPISIDVPDPNEATGSNDSHETPC